MAHGDLRYDNLAHKLAQVDSKRVVIAAYTNALKGPEQMRRSAFNAALRVYRMRHPGISEAIARRRVAQISVRRWPMCCHRKGWAAAAATGTVDKGGSRNRRRRPDASRLGAPTRRVAST